MIKPRLQSCAEIGSLIKRVRKELRLTQAQLSGLANTGIRFVGELESGKETCHAGKVLRVLSALGLGIYIYSPYDRECIN